MTPNFEAAIALERAGVEAVRALSIQDRGKLVEAACAGAVEIEESRIRMGLGHSTPAPWPDSTWVALAEWTRRARG